MTGWYPWRWMCKKCQAVHYYSPEQCCRCGHSQLLRQVNNQKAVDRDKKKENIRGVNHPPLMVDLEPEPDPDLTEKVIADVLSNSSLPPLNLEDTPKSEDSPLEALWSELISDGLGEE